MKAMFLCFVLCIQVAVAARPCHAQNMPVAYGWVSQAQLSDFAPERLQKPCNLLQQRHLAAAAVGFERELTKNPDSLVAYVGLVQANPALARDAEAPEANVAAHGDGTDADTEFKLGTLLFYEWGAVAAGSEQCSSDPFPNPSYASLAAAPLPIEGMMLIDTLSIGKVSGYLPLRRLNQAIIAGQLIAALGGIRTYKLYVQAKQKNWHSPPPPVSLVSSTNVKSLIGVVRYLKSSSNSRVSYGKVINGKTVFVDQPYTSPELAEQEYTASWLSSLFRVYQKQIG